MAVEGLQVDVDSPLPDLARYAVQVVDTLITEVRPRLVDAALAQNPGEQANRRHLDNFLSTHDLWMHDRYREELAQRLDRFVYASEEADPHIVGDDPDPDLCVLVDPLDTSELAVRGLNGYTHLMIYSRRLNTPVVSVVADIYHHIRFYLATRHQDGTHHAYLITADGYRHRLRLPAGQPVPLRRALVTNYLMRPAERFQPLAAQAVLLRALAAPDADGRSHGRIGVDFGSVSLCHVAAGFTDATIEFAKGFAIWDLAPGHHILHAAGGTTIDLDGQPIPLHRKFDTITDITNAMNRRQKFIAANSTQLAHEIRATLTAAAG